MDTNNKGYSINQLKEDLRVFDRIILIPYAENDLYNEIIMKTDKENPDRKMKVVRLGQDDELESLYLTYMFSSKVKLIRTKTNYGNCINYVRAGIITMEEYVDLKTLI